MKIFFVLSLLVGFSASADSINYEDPNMGFNKGPTSAALTHDNLASIGQAISVAENTFNKGQRSLSSNAPAKQAEEAGVIYETGGICPQIVCDYETTARDVKSNGTERGDSQ